MNFFGNFSRAAAIAAGLAGCAGNTNSTVSMPVLSPTEGTKIYSIEGARNCFAGEIGNILVIGCEGRQKIQLGGAISNAHKECDRLDGKIFCIYDGSLEDLSPKNSVHLIDIPIPEIDQDYTSWGRWEQ